MDVIESCRTAKEKAYYPARLSNEDKNKMLDVIASSLSDNMEEILTYNKADIERNRNLPAYLVDRLSLDENRINGIKKGILDVKSIPDPVGKILDSFTTADGLYINKISVPIGVIGIIYEARPNVTCDVISICIKTGNAVVLKGSSAANETNRILVKIIKNALSEAGYESEFIQYIDDPSHDAAALLMKQNDYIDVLIPRGSGAFIREVRNNSSIPTIETGAGNCHIYINEACDKKVARNILLNGKLQRQSVCNALESIVIDEAVADTVLPSLLDELFSNGVEIYGCEKTRKIYPKTLPAGEDDFYMEYLGPKISCKVVSGIDEAIEFINEHSTHHSECIISENKIAVSRFLNEIDSSCVYANASTRFTDGFMFGFGAEVGISTQKLHARGPIGPAQLISYKYQILGNGQCRK